MFRLFAIIAILASTAFAQEVKIGPVKTITQTVSSVTTTTATVANGSAIGEPVVVTVTSEPIIKEAYEGELVSIVTDAANVQVEVTNVARVPVEFTDRGNQQYLLAVPGKQWVDVTVVDFAKNIFFRRTYQVTVDDKTPDPGPDPDPDTDPDVEPPIGEAPIEGPGLRVLFVSETSEQLPRDVDEVFYSPIVAAWLNANCVKVDGQPEFRRVDADTQFTDPNHRFAKALNRPRASLPWLIVSDGKAGYEGPFPGGVQQTIELLKRFQAANAASVKVTVYSLPGCIECERFERDEMPKLQDLDIEVIHKAAAGIQLYPTFEITADGKTIRLTGRMSADGLRSRIKELQS